MSSIGEYKIEIEIFEGEGGQLEMDGETVVQPDFVKEGICAWMNRGDGNQSYQKGRRFSYPEEADLLCPMLLDSLRGIIRALAAGETLSWTYEGTPYEKIICADGITTEFVRCVDPTASGIVVKVIRTEL